MTLVVCLIAVRAASWLVPGPLRTAWRRAWAAEIWHYARLLRTHGVKDRYVRVRIRHHTAGALRDAWRVRSNIPGTRRLLSAIRKPAFSLGVIAVALAAIVVFSHGLAITRAMLAPHLADADRLVLVPEKSVQVGGRHPVSPRLLDYWRTHNTTLAGMAGFQWDKRGTAWVTPEFFEVLGTRPGRFLLRPIHDWEPVNNEQYLGVLGRLKPEVTPEAAEIELRDLALRYRHVPRPSLEAQVIPLLARIRQPLYTYGAMGALTIAILLAAAGIGIRADQHRSGGRIRKRYWAYFYAKSVSLPLALVLVIWEFSRATSFTVTADATFVAEPFFIWLVILASAAIVWWCLADQRVRCRACLQTLQYPVRIGSLGAVLFDHAGMELVCCEGHGSLYVPAVSSDYVQGGGWTGLDSADITEPVPR